MTVDKIVSMCVFFSVTTPKRPSLCVREVPATENPAAMTEMKHTHTPQ